MLNGWKFKVKVDLKQKITERFAGVLFFSRYSMCADGFADMSGGKL